MDKLPVLIKTIQPYFVMETKNFHQYILGKYGISHFYGYIENPNLIYRIAVPDGCLDILFEYGENNLQATVCGTVLEHKMILRKKSTSCFGVRFFPGFFPDFLIGKLSEFVDKQVSLKEISKSTQLLDEMSCAHNFFERVSIFMKIYKELYIEKTILDGKSLIIKTVENMIYNSCGEIRIKDIEKRSGYTARYINKLFNSELGLNPKKLCLIVKFQYFLAQLHSKKWNTILNLALDYGYFDQSYLIKEFSKYTDMTPTRYFKMVQTINYEKRIITYNKLSEANLHSEK